jgi:hypothetical protein
MEQLHVITDNIANTPVVLFKPSTVRQLVPHKLHFISRLFSNDTVRTVKVLWSLLFSFFCTFC